MKLRMQRSEPKFPAAAPRWRWPGLWLALLGVGLGAVAPVSAATAKKRTDGKYDVSFTVEGRKLYADGRGKETEAPLAEPFDVGVFTEEPGKKGYKRESVLLLDRRPLQSGAQVVTLTVDQAPKFVGVDPFNKRIDRNSDDNLTRVQVE